ncbi:hypothetical protein AYO45_05110 [Gammaproteobacteria bacterium SCGC AG-212-F23]|nr:hypothetical protein AYO45_05110 [Gammaproteobacteria bacterium SCGC AG-212-F23]
MKLITIATALCASLFTMSIYAAEISNIPTESQNMMSQSSQADKNKQAGDAFLAANKNKPGIVTLPDGLQYKVITEGKGTSPSSRDTVVVHYQGTLIDGKEFDSSYKRGEPATFPVGAVIAGWTEVLQLMKPGATWEVYIPASLAYGTSGMPPVIGPNETLIFKINLIEVKKS